MPLPTGAVTFVFTDIEGSTQRWEHHHAAMKDALVRHDVLMRDVIKRHNGYVFKTVGDAFCAVFNTPAAAVAAALEIQRGLLGGDFKEIDGLPVRIGVHTGLADERAGDYFGPAVNRVARLTSIAHGSQILISAATRELVKEEIADDVTLLDLGAHRLKDLTNPEHVWQVTTANLPAEFPPLLSLDSKPNNLPMQVTTFVGRERDLQELRSHVDEHRLVTLFGAGGVGKTRMAVQLGADLLDRFPDGVWVADFSRISDRELTTSVVAQAIGISRLDGAQVGESVQQYLKTKHLLLILDDCEHLVESIALLADSIHRNCPRVHIVATSRQVLGVSGEKVWRLTSLAVPQTSAELVPSVAITFGAVALFVDRATLADQNFKLTAGNAPVVATICGHLDGIPLAIELAAARVKVMSLLTVAQRLDERFKLLTGGSRTALPKQKTLTALFDWSYDLLSPQEQLLFRRVAIFAGGFTLAGATIVCSGVGIDGSDALDIMSSLAEKSLLAPDTRDAQERYRLLESTREYALEKLSASGERDLLASRHARYFLEVAAQIRQAFAGMPLAQALAEVAPLVDDFRAVLRWALGSGHDAALGGAVAAALESYWWYGGSEAEGRRWIELGLRQLDEQAHPEIVAQLRGALALLTSRMLYS
jgi:predicted ATPase/class 3 adenylate cyclase